MSKNNKFVLRLIAIIIPFIYVFPRILINTLGEASPWTSYLYLYVFGFIFFGCGLLLVTKTGACKLGRGRDSRWFTMLIAGFTWLVCLHGIWICFALFIPYKGG